MDKSKFLSGFGLFYLILQGYLADLNKVTESPDQELVAFMVICRLHLQKTLKRRRRKDPDV